jgi:hypothetical protein
MVVGAVLVATGLWGSAAGAAGLVAVPVARCATDAGVDLGAAPSIPSRILAAVSPADARRLSFYSNGYLTVLAPKGWTCSGLEAADGGEELGAYPAGQADPEQVTSPARGAQAVVVFRDYTGHGPGAQLVCSLFPNTAAARSAADLGCPKRPAHERVTFPIPTVARFHDAAHRRGTGTLSGGNYAADGAIVYPFADDNPDGSGVIVHKITCVLRNAALCPVIVEDFVVRATPAQQVPTGG